MKDAYNNKIVTDYYIGDPPRQLSREESQRLYMSVRYANEVGQHISTNKLEVSDKAKKILAEGKQSAAKIAAGNMGLVMKHTKKYSHGVRQAAEVLGNEGYAALVHAVQKYDLKQQKEFSTYATFWIRQKTKAKYLEETNNIKVPHNHPKVHAVQLDAPVQGTEDLLNKDVLLIADESTADTQTNLRLTIEKVLECLTPKEREVISEYYGFSDDGNDRGRTSYQSIGEAMGCSGETVRRIHDSGLARIKSSIGFVFNTDQIEIFEDMFLSS